LSKNLLAGTNSPRGEDGLVRTESTATTSDVVDDAVDARASVVRVGNESATSRQRRQVGREDQRGVCVSAEDGRGREAAAIGGDVSGRDGDAGVAAWAGVELEGNGVEALAHLRWGGVDADGSDEEGDGGCELHFEGCVGLVWLSEV